VISFTPLPLYPRAKALGALWIGGRVGPSRRGRHGEVKIIDPARTLTPTPIHRLFLKITVASLNEKSALGLSGHQDVFPPVDTLAERGLMENTEAVL
jgi:hypothetical protein